MIFNTVFIFAYLPPIFFLIEGARDTDTLYVHIHQIMLSTRGILEAVTYTYTMRHYCRQNERMVSFRPRPEQRVYNPGERFSCPPTDAEVDVMEILQHYGICG